MQTQIKNKFKPEYLPLAVAIFLGAVAMFILDPRQGASRRALVWQKGARLGRKAGDRGAKFTKHLINKTHGIRVGHGSRKAEHVDDEILVQRVRSAFGRFVSHPKSILVEADDGIIVLYGPILSREVQPLLACVKEVPGVTEVINQLEEHDFAGDIPGLQGEGKPYLQ